MGMNGNHDISGIYNLVFSYGPAEDHELKEKGYRFLGAARDSETCAEVHVFLKADKSLSEKAIQFLVMINDPDPFDMPFADRYRVYNDFDAAFAWATKNGYYSMMPINPKVGMLNMCKGGGVDVSIMAVEARDGIHVTLADGITQ
jgi:hypothetical protein